MIHWFSSIIWSLARRTPQFRAYDTNWAKLDARHLRDLRAQQKANRIKRRKLRGLREERARLKYLSALNSVHCEFIRQLEIGVPALRERIARHEWDRLYALSSKKDRVEMDNVPEHGRRLPHYHDD